MKETHDSLYAAFKAKDTRFDGRFFVGILSTKIYCRPVCRAKQAKKENCIFFSSAAQAEAAGFRPCILCRPELAPGNALIDAHSVIAHKAAIFLEENCGSGQKLSELAKKLGCTDRHLRRVFIEEYQVSPIQYLQTCRLLLAKKLLTDTNLSILNVAMAAGFGSLRRFNDLFQKQYKISPTSLRKKAVKGEKHTTEITVGMGYRPPYQWERLLNFLSVRAIPGVEIVKNKSYMRTVRITDNHKKEVYGWICVSNHSEKNSIEVTLSDTLLSVLPQVLARVRLLFDLYCNPYEINETLKSMNDISQDIWVAGTRIPGCFEPFETAVRAILGQQISVKAATALSGKIAQNCGKAIVTGIEGLTHTFPTVEDIAGLDNIEEYFGKLGVMKYRAKCIFELAQMLIHGNIVLNQCVNPEEEIKKLLQIKGIGNWTAKYIAMRTMGWTDAFLETDAGIKKHYQIILRKNCLNYLKTGARGEVMLQLVYGILYK